jgi:hypothetical protein
MLYRLTAPKPFPILDLCHGSIIGVTVITGNG